MRFFTSALTFALVCLAYLAEAAEITTSETGRCRLTIDGPIQAGDFTKVEALKDRFVIFDGESTQLSVACLNSPGGSVSEGLKIARLFYDEGVSTYVGAEQKCYSICAVIFMMGSVAGPEVGGIKRTLHVDGTLGFHRPYLTLDDVEAYTSGDLNGAFDWGVTTVLEFIQLATLPDRWSSETMIPSSLVQVMLETPPDRMHVITKVHEVLHWKIRLDGVTEPDETFAIHKFWACENAISVSGGPAPFDANPTLLSDAIFSFAPLPRQSAEIALAGMTNSTPAHPIASLRQGYVDAACNVIVNEASVGICGFDQNTDTRIGECQTRDYRYWDTHVLTHPQTNVSMLSLKNSFVADASRAALCKVKSDAGEIVDDEVCFQFVYLRRRDDRILAQHNILWPSGSRTVIEVPTIQSDQPGRLTINGQSATVTPRNGHEACLRNSGSGNTFCISAP